jgi:hypothetical protein
MGEAYFRSIRLLAAIVAYLAATRRDVPAVPQL